MHKVKTVLADMGGGAKQAGRDIHRTQHPPKVSALLCFSHTFSRLSSAAITHHPRPTSYTQDRIKVPSFTRCQACKEVQGEICYHAFKSHHHLQKWDFPQPPFPWLFPRQRSREVLAFLQGTRQNTPLLAATSLLLTLPLSPLPSPHHPCVTPNELP